MTAGPFSDWELIVDEHTERVFRIAHRILGSIHDAEDVSQEVFIEAFALRKSIVASWTAFLVRLATVRSLDRLRKLRKHCRYLVISEEDRFTSEEPIDLLVTDEIAELLRDEVAQLPSQQASVFAMSCFEELSNAEIATALGISLQAVATCLHKARKNLQSQVSFHCRGGVK